MKHTVRFWRWAGYLIYVFCVLLVINYLFYLRYRRKIYSTAKDPGEMREITHVDQETFRRLGWLKGEKKTSFTNFSVDKPQGVIRIGCFGDSFTYGAEVDARHDYPHFLQELFAQNGFHNVEVINFGMGAYGFGQSFMLWKAVGRRFGLDYILLGPEGFQVNRAITFCGWGGPRQAIYAKRARYILNGDDVRLIDVVGKTFKERTAVYSRFIPPLRYVLYDIAVPAFIECLVPEGRTLKRNPFYYYKGSVYKEVKEISRILLSKMAASDATVILGHYRQEVTGCFQDINKHNLHITNVHRFSHFPYQAVGGHNSALGNQAVAQQFFDYVRGEKESNFLIVRTEDIEPAAAHQLVGRKNSLSSYSGFALEVGGQRIGRLLGVPYTKQGYWYTSINPFLWEKLEGVSLLGIYNEGSSVLDGLFMDLPFAVEEGMRLSARFSVAGGERQVFLGTVKRLHPRLPIGRVQCRDVEFSGEIGGISFRGKAVIEGVPYGASAEIVLEDRVLFKGIVKDVGGNKALQVVSPHMKRFRVTKNVPMRIESFADTEIIFLVLIEEEGTEIKIPVARLRKTPYRVVFSSGPAPEKNQLRP